MAITTIKHPQVTVSYNQSIRSRATAAPDNSTVLFAPFGSKKGPANKPIKISSIAEFISVYGQLNYSEQGQVVLNIGNWLSAGGSVMSYRTFDKTLKDSDITPMDFGGKTFIKSIGLDVEYDVANLATIDSNGMILLAGTSTEIAANDPLLSTSYFIGNGIKVVAKYPGSFYNGISVRIEKTSNASLFNIYVLHNNVIVETFRNKSNETYKNITKTSNYISELSIGNTFKAPTLSTPEAGGANAFIAVEELTLGTIIAEGSKSFESLPSANGLDDENVMTASKMATALESIQDHLMYDIDVLLDAGYPADIKKTMVDIVTSTDYTTRRDDIVLFLDTYELDYKENKIPTANITYDGNISYVNTTVQAAAVRNRNVRTESDLFSQGNNNYLCAIYAEYLSTEDIYSATSQGEVYVTPTYFLASLIPANDRAYGLGTPIAGQRYGVIDDALSLSRNPSYTEKDDMHSMNINYIEKDSRATCFFTNRTQSAIESDLVFVNNVRVANRMNRDLRKIGRYQLHEASDITTLNIISENMKTYMNNWLESRVIRNYDVNVYLDENDNTIAYADITVQFTGTLEAIIISINL